MLGVRARLSFRRSRARFPPRPTFTQFSFQFYFVYKSFLEKFVVNPSILLPLFILWAIGHYVGHLSVMITADFRRSELTNAIALKRQRASWKQKLSAATLRTFTLHEPYRNPWDNRPSIPMCTKYIPFEHVQVVPSCVHHQRHLHRWLRRERRFRDYAGQAQLVIFITINLRLFIAPRVCLNRLLHHH